MNPSSALLDSVASWPVRACAVAVIDAHGTRATREDASSYAWASVTKLLTAFSVLIDLQSGSHPRMTAYSPDRGPGASTPTAVSSCSATSSRSALPRPGSGQGRLLRRLGRRGRRRPGAYPGPPLIAALSPLAACRVVDVRQIPGRCAHSPVGWVQIAARSFPLLVGLSCATEAADAGAGTWCDQNATGRRTPFVLSRGKRVGRTDPR